MIINHEKPYNVQWILCPVCGSKTRLRIRGV
ncbi:MAG: cysteine-rich KTR domain-containing protein [Lachnospiraceae bacterium]|nr:cysteine-rich KTR domain-containing protein [Lachnospiraceae bacterium]